MSIRTRNSARVGLMAFVVLMVACEPPLVPDAVDPQFAAGGGPSVQAADPPEAVQDTTLDVRVIGSGFDDGSVVRFLINGQSAPKLLVNSSTYVDRNTLIANVTVEPDAALAVYDIEVMSIRGKKGVGTELFSVKEKAKPNEDPVLPDETTWIEVGYGEEGSDADPVGEVWGAWRQIGPVGETFSALGITMELDRLRQEFSACFTETYTRGSLYVTTLGGGLGEARFVFDAFQRDGTTPQLYELVMTGPVSGPWPAQTNQLSRIDLTDWVLDASNGGPPRDKCLGSGAFETETTVRIFPVPEHGPIDPITPFLRRPFTGDFPVGWIADHTDDDGDPVTFWGETLSGPDGVAATAWALPVGTPVLAAADGVVIVSRSDPPHYQCGQFIVGRHFVALEHALPDGRTVATVYKGLQGPEVSVGQVVSAGDQIGRARPADCGTWTVQMEVRVHNPAGISFPTLYYTWTDPYGWSGGGPDPLLERMRGTNSYDLWLPGEAPTIYREAVEESPDPASPLWVTRFRWLGVDDASNPNNEFVDVELNPTLNPTGSLDLGGYRLVSTATGAAYTFPGGFTLATGAQVRVFTGSGSDTTTELYWGRPSGVYPNDLGQTCAALQDPSGVELTRLCD